MLLHQNYLHLLHPLPAASFEGNAELSSATEPSSISSVQLVNTT
jgi:hypothetical protein